MITFERIKYLSEKQGKSLNKVEEELGYGKNVLYRLKNTNPSAERLQEIADYFDVSVDYLLGRTGNPSPIDSATRDFKDVKFDDDDISIEGRGIGRDFDNLKPTNKALLKKMIAAMQEDDDDE